MSLVIGLTGGIASGKSTISTLFKEIGITVIDADREARYAVQPGEEAYIKIVDHFGKSILLQDGQINRGKLGEIIFSNQKLRERLNRIVHPEVRKRMLEKKEQAIKKNEKVVVLDIPLLFENDFAYMVDKTILVYVDRRTQLSRLMQRNSFTEQEASLRINSQMPLEEKLKLADAIIDNNGTIENSKKQLVNILNGWL